LATPDPGNFAVIGGVVRQMAPLAPSSEVFPRHVFRLVISVPYRQDDLDDPPGDAI